MQPEDHTAGGLCEIDRRKPTGIISQLTAPSGARLLTGNASFLPGMVSRPSAGQAPRQTGDDPRTDHDQARFNPPRSPTRESARHRPGTRLSGRRGHIFWNLDRGDECLRGRAWNRGLLLVRNRGYCQLWHGACRGMHAVACVRFLLLPLYFVSLPLLSGFRTCPHWPTRCALGCFGTPCSGTDEITRSIWRRFPLSKRSLSTVTTGIEIVREVKEELCYCTMVYDSVEQVYSAENRTTRRPPSSPERASSLSTPNGFGLPDVSTRLCTAS